MTNTELTADFVAKALKLRGTSESNMRVAFPLLETALLHVGGRSWNSFAAAIATVHVETGDFGCKEEQGPMSYFDRYENRVRLGNTTPGDGYKFRGRGYIQLTGRANYEHFGPLVGEDLVVNPELALHPPVAAMIFAAYWKERGCIKAADAGNWQRVRLLVNGGTNGLSRFKESLAALGAAI